MNSKDRLKDKLLERGIRISHQKKVTQHLFNDSLNETNLNFEKNSLLFDAIRNHTELLNVKKHYPENDLQDIDLDLDVIVIKVKDLEKVFEDELLHFPNLK